MRESCSAIHHSAARLARKRCKLSPDAPPFGSRADQGSASSRSEVRDRRPHDSMAGFGVVGGRPPNRGHDGHGGMDSLMSGAPASFTFNAPPSPDYVMAENSSVVPPRPAPPRVRPG